MEETKLSAISEMQVYILSETIIPPPPQMSFQKFIFKRELHAGDMNKRVFTW